ncbi:MAG: ammonium transporter [Candidatus Lambdaproteobacteria bacterium]|nr:ammonium transporter [Candidatus Lambdaproteobacteria bacterium]
MNHDTYPTHRSGSLRRAAGGLVLALFLSLSAATIYGQAAPPAPAAAMPAPATPPAPTPPAPTLDTGNTAWMLTSTALVLLMTIPGLALFYAGMVRKKNILGTAAQAFAVTCLVTVLWAIAGYSLAFTQGTPFLGGFSRFMLGGIEVSTLSAGNVPESVFAMFQLTFAIITPALIAGAFADRMKFSALLWFMGLWLLLVYVPIAHWVWGAGGFLGALGVLDYAGGTVVHINAGIAGLVAALVMGHRRGYGQENMPPHNLMLSFVGASLLWVGWFGFNAGSAVAADGRAGMAMTVTQIASATAALSWMACEWALRAKPSVLGMISGAVAGLVAITPASGFVGPGAALVIGLAAGAACFSGSTWLKRKAGYDDSLDAFGVHGVGGTVGAVLTGVFASKAIGGTAGLTEGNPMQVLTQVYGILATMVYCAVVSFIILKVVDLVIGLRISSEDETEGLDLSQHGEALQ